MHAIAPDADKVRQQLLARRTVLRDRLRRIEADLQRRNDPLSPDFADRAVQRENDEVLEALGLSAQEELAHIDEALKRVDRQSYGLCVRCGEEIEPHRLHALPYTLTCVACTGNREISGGI